MISVIMLTYNRESMVGRAIESILNQTYRDFEYIIVDNGSDDRSGEIADAYAAKDPRIKVLHIEKVILELEEISVWMQLQESISHL